MASFDDGDRVSWAGKQVDCRFYGTIVTRPAPGIYIVRTSGGAKLDVTEDRLTREFPSGVRNSS
jgi:hypothetical protein